MSTMKVMALALAIFAIAAGEACASSSFSSTARAKGNGWAADSGVRFYSEDDKAYFLALDDCEFEIDAFARGADEEELIKRTRQWAEPITGDKYAPVDMVLLAIARPLRRINIFSSTNSGLCDTARITTIVIGRGPSLAEFVRGLVGVKYAYGEIGMALFQYDRRRLPNGGHREVSSQLMILKKDWFTPKQEDRAIQFASAITLGLFKILFTKKP